MREQNSKRKLVVKDRRMHVIDEITRGENNITPKVLRNMIVK